MGNFHSSIHKTISSGDLLRKCKTGDIILFKGRSIFSCAVRCTSHSSGWTHVAMIYKNDEGQVFMFESTYDEGKVIDVLSKR